MFLSCLMSSSACKNGGGEGGGLVLWADGCFDMVHFGHANALRQAKKLGSKLIVGVHSDDDIIKNKGPPVFNEQERYRMVRAIKWVDDVAEGAPFVTSLDVMDQYGADVCVHGDDIVNAADGENSYRHAIRAGRFKTFPRTRGVSTTNLVGRMLLATKSHFDVGPPEATASDGKLGDLAKDASGKSPYTSASVFLSTTGLISHFMQGRVRKEAEKVIYVCGGFDLFHIGHLAFLEECLKLGGADGAYIIVGIYTDETVNNYKGQNYPIMNMQERVLTVLAYKPVAEVVIGAPYTITKDIIDHFSVDYVCHGCRTPVVPDKDGGDPHQVAKDLGIFRLVESGNDMTTDKIIRRILTNREKFLKRNAAKEDRELKTISEMSAS